MLCQAVRLAEPLAALLTDVRGCFARRCRRLVNAPSHVQPARAVRLGELHLVLALAVQLEQRQQRDAVLRILTRREGLQRGVPT